MLICDKGHRTKVYVHMIAGDETIYSGIPHADQLRDILAALDEGACPVCASLGLTE